VSYSWIPLPSPPPEGDRLYTSSVDPDIESAFFAVKVSSDKQTLILAGEAIPPRADVGLAMRRAETGLQLKRVAMLFVRGEYTSTLTPDSSPAGFLAATARDRALLPPAAAVAAPAAPAQFLVPYSSSNRIPAAGAAEYARTQNLSDGRTRSRIIDTYA